MKHTSILLASVLSVLGACVASSDETGDSASAITTAEAIAELGPFVDQVIAPVAGPRQLADSDNAGPTEEALTAALEDPACVSSSLSGLSITLAYDDCVNRRGETVDGALTFALELAPLRLSMTVDGLTVGASAYDGTLGLTFPAGGGAVIDADIGLALAGDTQLSLESATVAASAGQLTINGSAQLASATDDIAVTADQLTWTGECLPTGGEVHYNDGSVTGTLVFGADTPSTGIVTAVVGPLSFEIELAPCE